MKKIVVVFGTRPEAIKLAPVILALRAQRDIDCKVCVTAQHRQLLDQVLDVFRIIPDVDLDLMRPNQSLSELTSRAINTLDTLYKKELPDIVLVQGDTTTALCATLAAFYNKIAIGHIEAGLRSGNLYSPWPEEGNRILTSHLATLHFAPTEDNKANLLREGIPEYRIFVTGNTIVDALHSVLMQIKNASPRIPGLPPAVMKRWEGHPVVLITGHRRENFGPRFESICNAIAELARLYPEAHFVFPVHLNPNVRIPVERILGSLGGNVHLIEPIPYKAFVALMNRATFILSDSGGIQEEGPSMGKPVLVMRDTTERPEAVSAGWAKLVGTGLNTIVKEASALIEMASGHADVVRQKNPFGDGHATERIVRICRVTLNLDT